MKLLNAQGVLVILFMIGCGPSEAELQLREQQKQDSLNLVKQKNEELRIHEQKIEVGKQLTKNRLREIEKKLESNLAQEKLKLNKIQEFKWGRSESQKSRQLQAQRSKINQIERKLDGVRNEIAHAHMFHAYDQQSTPEGTVKLLFESAKSGDYKKVRHLKDPYGEYSNDVFEVCSVEMMLSEDQEGWKMMLKNGRIMGKSKIKNNQAEIEIAVGHQSDMLETVFLTQRMDKWYLLKFE